MGTKKRKVTDLVDLEAGQVFGYLTVLHRVDGSGYNNGRESQRYLCQCECGNTVVLGRAVLLNGSRKSCGCRHPATLPKREKAPITNSSVYAQWRRLKECPHDESWDSYPGFKEWSIKNGCVPHAKLILQGSTNFWGPKTCMWLSGEALNIYRDSIRKLKRLRSTRTHNAQAKQLRVGRSRLKRGAKVPFRDLCALTVQEWSEVLNIPAISIYNRLANTKTGTMEEAFYAPYKDRDVVAEMEEYADRHIRMYGRMEDVDPSEEDGE